MEVGDEYEECESVKEHYLHHVVISVTRNGEGYGKRNQYPDDTDVGEGMVFASLYRVSFFEFLVSADEFPYSTVRYRGRYQESYYSFHYFGIITHSKYFPAFFSIMSRIGKAENPLMAMSPSLNPETGRNWPTTQPMKKARKRLMANIQIRNAEPLLTL